MSISLLLIRHAQHCDVGKRLTGRGPEEGLTPTGREEAEALASLLGSEPFSAIYASPRLRTQQTAAILAGGRGLAVQSIDALDEIDFGEWTGRSFDELNGDPVWTEWNASRSIARCPRGESMGEAQRRAVKFVLSMAGRHDGRQVALITHCDIIRALLCWSEGRSLDTILDREVDPASVRRIEVVSSFREAA